MFAYLITYVFLAIGASIIQTSVLTMNCVRSTMIVKLFIDSMSNI